MFDETKKSFTVLAIDDFYFHTDLYKELFKAIGIKTITAEDGKEGLKVLSMMYGLEITPDIVFTDLNMPIVDGVEVVQTIKQDYPSVPVYVVTGLSSEAIRESYPLLANAKPDGILSKSLDLGTIVSIVEKHGYKVPQKISQAFTQP